jgi:hypothetical protein
MAAHNATIFVERPPEAREDVISVDESS